MSAQSEWYDGHAWAEWVKELDPEASWEQRADKMGVKRSSVFRYQSGEQMVPPEAIVEFARNYGSSPVFGFIAAGYLQEDDVRAVATAMSVDEALLRAEDHQLTDHILLRLERVSGAHPDFTEPLSGESTSG